jgi:hypothetical protein
LFSFLVVQCTWKYLFVHHVKMYVVFGNSTTTTLIFDRRIDNNKNIYQWQYSSHVFFSKGDHARTFLNKRYHCAFLVEKYFISLNYTNGNWHRWSHTYEIVSYAYICDNNIRSMLIKQVAKKISRQIKIKTKMRAIKSKMMRILHSVDDVDVSLKERKWYHY